MSLTGISFVFFFLPVSMALYRIVPVKFRNYLLLLLSLFFIAWGNPADIILIGLSIVFNYFTASELAELRSRQKTALKKFVLATGIAANVALLIFFRRVVRRRVRAEKSCGLCAVYYILRQNHIRSYR